MINETLSPFAEALKKALSDTVRQSQMEEDLKKICNRKQRRELNAKKKK